MNNNKKRNNGYTHLPVMTNITANELHKNPLLVRDVKRLGYREGVPYSLWQDHVYKLAWQTKRVVVDHTGKFAPPNLDIMLPPDDIIDAGGYDQFVSMIADRFRTAFEKPVLFDAKPYFQVHTLGFFAVIATVLAAARPEVSETWTSRRIWAANDNYLGANDNAPWEKH